MQRSLNIINLIMILTSSLSLGGCIYMIYAIMICRDVLKRPSFQIFMNMAVSNLLAASGTIYGGTPPNGSFACWWQGIATNVFPLVTIFLNVALLVTFYAYCQLIHVSTSMILIFCWGLPILMSFIPLAFHMTYGREDYEWCWLMADSSGTVSDVMVANWYWIAFYMWVWLAFVIGSVIMYYLNVIFIFKVAGPTRLLMSEKLRIIKYFPLVSVLSWGLLNFTDTILMIAPDMYIPEYVEYISDALGCLYGFLIAMAFLYSTRHTREAKARQSYQVQPVLVSINSQKQSSIHSHTFNNNNYIVSVQQSDSNNNSSKNNSLISRGQLDLPYDDMVKLKDILEQERRDSIMNNSIQLPREADLEELIINLLSIF